MTGLREIARRALDPNLVLMDPGLPLERPFGARRIANGPSPFPLDALGDPARLALTFSASAALYQAMQTLGIRAGDVVLVPAYNCGHEVEPIVRAGAAVDLYGVDPDLRVDLADLARRLRAPVRAVLVTHYFGLPQPLDALRKLCDEAGAVLIEDCAHAFLSSDQGRPLGSVGQLAVFSLRKTLPIPDGGALLSNDPGLLLAVSPAPPPLGGTLAKRVDLWQKAMMRGGALPEVAVRRACLLAAVPVLAARRVVPRLWGQRRIDWYDPDDESFDLDVSVLTRSMSETSARLLTSFDFAEILARRCENYRALLGLLAPLGERVLPPPLPSGACPLLFPIRADRPIALARALWERGVSAEAFWPTFHPALPWSRYPEAVERKRSTLVLPIHHDLGVRELERMSAELCAQIKG